eukprot:jgi/Hompol1/347/HPOL_002886-RA
MASLLETAALALGLGLALALALVLAADADVDASPALGILSLLAGLVLAVDARVDAVDPSAAVRRLGEPVVDPLCRIRTIVDQKIHFTLAIVFSALSCIWIIQISYHNTRADPASKI